MVKQISLDSLMDNIEFMKSLYDIVRITDPITKKVLTYIGEEISEEDTVCYDFWNQGRICENCISIRAYNQKETLVKIEYNGEKIMMVTASPVAVEDKVIVLELLKDITNKGIVENAETKSIVEIRELLNKKNDLVLRDPLTKAYNKRYINERLPFDLVDTLIKEEYLTVFMADIDFFKKVNDTYGHVAGDYVLQKFVQKLSSCLREHIDWIARYGGEEFLICIRNIEMDNSYMLAEEMRKAVEDMNIEYKNQLIKITASFGGITLYKTKMDLDCIIDMADKNLYMAKNSGRNKTVITEVFHE